MDPLPGVEREIRTRTRQQGPTRPLYERSYGHYNTPLLYSDPLLNPENIWQYACIRVIAYPSSGRKTLDISIQLCYSLPQVQVIALLRPGRGT